MKATILAGAVLLAACGGTPTEPGLEPMDSQLIERAMEYYAAMEDCSGVDGNATGVRWLQVVNRRDGESVHEPPLGSHWIPPNDVIIGVHVSAAGAGAYGVDLRRGSLRHLLKTNDLPQWAIDACSASEGPYGP